MVLVGAGVTKPISFFIQFGKECLHDKVVGLWSKNMNFTQQSEFGLD
jgi:hypothetical protein